MQYTGAGGWPELRKMFRLEAPTSHARFFLVPRNLPPQLPTCRSSNGEFGSRALLGIPPPPPPVLFSFSQTTKTTAAFLRASAFGKFAYGPHA